jgi:hypothetical protein
VRWQPDGPVCKECDFDWNLPRRDAVALVAGLPERARGAVRNVADPYRRRGERWSAAMYVWHLVDVMRAGTERLLTVRLDPQAAIPCWDENLLAKARRYQQLSVVTGLAVLAAAVDEWVRTAQAAPVGQVTHAQLGSLTTIDLIRRNAHEAQHHLQDIRQARRD